MKKKQLFESGFSLMEMMVVLLIISIVAAASAPMISKKMIRSTSGSSPWVWVGTSGNIAYNLNGNNDAIASIGAALPPNEAGKPNLYIQNDGTKAFLTAGNGSNFLKFLYNNGGISISDSANPLGANAVAIGTGSSASNAAAVSIGNTSKSNAEGAIAMGPSSNASSINSIAIGRNAQSEDANDGIAIGSTAYAGMQDTIAIGRNSSCDGGFSIAIGQASTAVGEHSIAIGTQTGETNVRAAGLNAIAVGTGAQTLGENTIAIGGNSVIASAQSASSLGDNARSVTQNSIAIGKNVIAGGTRRIRNNSNVFATVAGATNAIALGTESQASAVNTVALGTDASAGASGTIAIGENAKAGYTRQRGNYNIDTNAVQSTAIGHNAVAGHANSVAIGTNAETTAENQIVLGDANTTVYIPGNLVVGRNTDLSADGRFLVRMRIPHEDGYGNNFFSRGDQFHAGIDNDSLTTAWQWRVLSSQGGNSNYNAQADVRIMKNSLDQVNAHDVNYSDRRLKDVGEAFTGGLEQIRKLEIFNFTFKKDKAKTPRVGIIAQDLQKIFPDAVTKGDDGFLRIRMEDMFYALVNAVKELDKKVIEISEQLKSNIDVVTKLSETVTAQQEEIKAQKAEIKELKSQLEEMNEDFEKRLAKLEKKVKNEK